MFQNCPSHTVTEKKTWNTNSPGLNVWTEFLNVFKLPFFNIPLNTAKIKKSETNKFSAFYFTDHLRYFGYQLVLGKQFHANIVNKKFKVTSVAENQAKTRFMVGYNIRGSPITTLLNMTCCHHRETEISPNHVTVPCNSSLRGGTSSSCFANNFLRCSRCPMVLNKTGGDPLTNRQTPAPSIRKP